ncbi:MCP four helix bundle domain-containing protein [Maribacter sp. PR1]|uniref:MCP four helix bundle domain-containing protein n=1 Tax=Maribacter cobaltidurans TaxID=1178778 RepID=A0ABU7ISJ8_9FLAO|nr:MULTISPECIES: MCP four helix bundle domain-containing protein [Maribacter]MDC6388566.1 MCP four helix bundle domain-containing protein [Maribacter sp. PR1]MEE1975955.1 MCP four helix bundle domain-containing protein [Maribacter cobaltidurans]
MTILSKIKWILGISMIFILIIATNLIDRNNFLRVKDSVTTIYEDRLVVKNIIFEIDRYIHEKELAMVRKDSAYYNNKASKINDKIQNLILRYQETKLTKEEAKVFEELKQNLVELKAQEVKFVESGKTQKTLLESSIDDVKENLYDLSQIQLSEGNRQMNISKKAVDTVELFTQLEIYILIFLAILIQVIIIYNPKNE